ncbi:MAG: arylsulfatase [Chitinophagia bacterium]
MIYRYLTVCVTLIFTITSVAQVRPNIIYIYSDDLGYGELGSYGQQKIKTPYLDQLAAEGIRFTQHYASAPVCAPSRCMLLTGKHSGHAAIRGNHELGGFADSSERGQQPLPTGTFTIGHLMKQAGYATAIIGKWGLGMASNSGNPNLHGFDFSYGYLDQKQAHNYYPTHLWKNGVWDTLFNPEINVHKRLDSTQLTEQSFAYYQGKTYAPDKITQQALSFIRKQASQPFFLYLPYTLPHLSLQIPDSLLEAYKGVFNERAYYGQKGYASHPFPLSAYAAMITYLDKQVGIILQQLQELKLDSNTLIMFSSDNGATFDVGGANTPFFFSNGKLRGTKGDVFEGGIRVPMIARWPGKIAPATISNHVSVQYDVMATLAEITNQKILTTDGISFLPTLIGKIAKQTEHPFLYFEFPETGGQLAIRMGKWKGIKRDMHKNPEKPWMLFDLESDPSETTNVFLQNPSIIRQMEKIAQREHQHPILREWEIFNTHATNK